MKKLLPVTPVVLFFLLSFFPFCKVTALLFGFNFCLYSDLAFAVVTAGLSCVLTGMLFTRMPLCAQMEKFLPR